tara:strand:- start:226605 stop:228509 length:1905 start_codon:yes stop_codon:yes gene_type:complete
MAVYLLVKRQLKFVSFYPFVAYVVFIGIGVGAITFHNALNKANHYTSYINEQTSSKVVLQVNRILKPNDYYNKYQATVLKVGDTHTQGNVLMNVLKDKNHRTFHVDDKLYVKTNFHFIDEPKNPYQFNYSNYLERQQVYRQISVAYDDFLMVKSKPNSLKGLAHQLRVNINESLIKNGFTGDELAIVNALLLGQRQEISKELLENYSKAGAIHILAVSGLHVGIILLIISVFLSPLKRLKHGKNIRLILTILLLWAFAFIAGMSASVIRAVTMFTALSIGIAANRKHSIYKNLIISMFFLLLLNPYYLFQVGFQLSYLAVFFIVWIQPIIYGVWKPRLKGVDYFWQLFTVSMAAQIGVLPLSLYYFHQFPGLFFVANLAIIPVLGLILGMGIGVILLSLMSVLPSVLATIYQNVIEWMNQLIAWVAMQESFVFQDISFSMAFVLVTYLLIVFSFRWIEAKTIANLKYVLITIVLVQGVFIYEKYTAISTNEFVIFNQSRNSILTQKIRDTLNVYYDDKLDRNLAAIKTYKTGSNSRVLNEKGSVKNYYQFDKESLLVIDSFGVYAIEQMQPTIILLRESPKINLKRLYNKLKPDLIIADASNYKSYVALWKTTCLDNNINFHYTVRDGAYIKKY